MSTLFGRKPFWRASGSRYPSEYWLPVVSNLITTYGDAVHGRYGLPIPSNPGSFRTICLELKKAARRTYAQAERDLAALDRQFNAAPDEAAIAAASSVAAMASRHVDFWNRLSDKNTGRADTMELFRFITSHYGL